MPTSRGATAEMAVITMAEFLRLFFLEHDDVLARQHFERLSPLQGMAGHFLSHLRFGHFVKRFDRHGRIFASEFHEHDSTRRF